MADAIEKAGTDDPAALMALWKRAAALVDREWPAITTIARVLQLSGQVPGAAVELLWRAEQRRVG